VGSPGRASSSGVTGTVALAWPVLGSINGSGVRPAGAACRASAGGFEGTDAAEGGGGVMVGFTTGVSSTFSGGRAAVAGATSCFGSVGGARKAGPALGFAGSFVVVSGSGVRACLRGAGRTGSGGASLSGPGPNGASRAPWPLGMRPGGIGTGASYAERPTMKLSKTAPLSPSTMKRIR
jgi:hypothetical protein